MHNNIQTIVALACICFNNLNAAAIGFVDMLHDLSLEAYLDIDDDAAEANPVREGKEAYETVKFVRQSLTRLVESFCERYIIPAIDAVTQQLAATAASFRSLPAAIAEVLNPILASVVEVAEEGTVVKKVVSAVFRCVFRAYAWFVVPQRPLSDATASFNQICSFFSIEGVGVTSEKIEHAKVQLMLIAELYSSTKTTSAVLARMYSETESVDPRSLPAKLTRLDVARAVVARQRENDRVALTVVITKQEMELLNIDAGTGNKKR